MQQSGAPILSIVAPPGYGKSTLLSQWAEQSAGPVAWISLDRDDNDPEILLSYLVAALDRVDAAAPELFAPTTRRRGSTAATAARRVAASIAATGANVTLAFDHVELLTNDECLDAVAELALHLPPGGRLALATRGRPPLPMARLRANGHVTEIGVDDLAMDDTEARALLEQAGVTLGESELIALLDRTEGWPAGLYLAALALRAGSSDEHAGYRFSGDDRLMADYLRTEFLDRLSPSEVTFLTRTAVLDRMSGSLCDAVLDTTGSADMLETLEDSNLLVIGLDRQRHWYRYHHLFRDLLLADLERREPALVTELHARAATWCAENQQEETALEHAQRAGDGPQVAALVLELAQPAWASGRVDTVLRWMEWLEQAGEVENHPEVAVHGALIFALLGRPIDAERWAAAAEGAPTDMRLADGTTMGSSLAYLRTLLCRNGIDEMRREAQTAFAGLHPASPYRASMLYTEGLAYLMAGDPDQAEPILAHALDAAATAGAEPLSALILAQRALVAIEVSNWNAAASHSQQARSLIDEHSLHEYWTSALVFALVARVALHRGDVDGGRDNAARAARLRPLLTYALPVVSVQALLELGRVYVALSDTAGAREVVRQARDILQQRPELGILPKQVDELGDRLDGMRSGAAGATSLTTAELRLVPFLSTHLTFPAIGERLHISRHTVKSQAISIYQKLGVSSRSEAIQRMHEIGLIDS